MAASGESNNAMAFVIGALVVAVGVLAWTVFGNGAEVLGFADDSSSVTIELPDVDVDSPDS